MAAGVPKAFYQLEGQTLVERAVDGLLDTGVVNTVVVAVPPGLNDEAKLILGDKATVVAGGANRAAGAIRRTIASVASTPSPNSGSPRARLAASSQPVSPAQYRMPCTPKRST